MSKSITEILTDAGLLTPQNQEAISRHRNPDQFVEALSWLQQAGILNQENFGRAAAHAKPYV